MRGPRLLIVVVAALTVAACVERQQPAYSVADPATGKALAAMPQPMAQARAVPQGIQQRLVVQGRGLFTGGHGLRTAYTRPPAAMQPPSVIQYRAEQPPPRSVVTRPSHVATASAAAAASAAYGAVPANSSTSAPYTLDSGDRLRVVVFGQDGISSSYTVDAGGNVNLPLVGTISARGRTTQALAASITARLKHGYVRDPNVSVEIEAYRPFFILGEVTTPGQYPYVANITAEAAVAIAGGFTPRAAKRTVELSRTAAGQRFHRDVPLDYPIRPGDTIVVKERWF